MKQPTLKDNQTFDNYYSRGSYTVTRCHNGIKTNLHMQMFQLSIADIKQKVYRNFWQSDTPTRIRKQFYENWDRE